MSACDGIRARANRYEGSHRSEAITARDRGRPGRSRGACQSSEMDHTPFALVTFTCFLFFTTDEATSFPPA